MMENIEPQIALEDDPEFQWRIKKAKALVELHQDHLHEVLKASRVIPIGHLGPEDLGRDTQRLYFHIFLGALLAQDVPVHSATVLAMECAAYQFRQLRLMPEAGNA